MIKVTARRRADERSAPLLLAVVTGGIGAVLLAAGVPGLVA